MSIERFDDECPGCRPAMMDVRTGKLFPADSAEMKIVDRLWRETTPEERRAWHRFTCQNSRALVDVQLAEAFGKRLEHALSAMARQKGSA